MGDRGMNVTANFHLVPRLRMSGAIPPSTTSICLNGEDKDNVTFLTAAEASVFGGCTTLSLIYRFTAEEIL
jgi:hypothetical protein